MLGANGEPVPGDAGGANQQGKYVAKLLIARSKSKTRHFATATSVRSRRSGAKAQRGNALAEAHRLAGLAGLERRTHLLPDRVPQSHHRYWLAHRGHGTARARSGDARLTARHCSAAGSPNIITVRQRNPCRWTAPRIRPRWKGPRQNDNRGPYSSPNQTVSRNCRCYRGNSVWELRNTIVVRPRHQT
jgi:hypothetical protein